MTSKSTCSKNDQIYKNLQKEIEKIPFDKYAKESLFKKRKEQKITGKVLVIGFILMALQGKNTFQQWASHIGLLTGETVSKQGVWKRITEEFISFLELVVHDIFTQKASEIIATVPHNISLKKYKRVLLQDSTIVALPSWLSWCYPGNVSKSKKKAQLKIQLVYDLLNNRIIHFEITSFSRNDQSSSKDILHIAQKGDLIVRDLGYFVLDCFEQMKNKDIHFISRLRSGVSIFDEQTASQINLVKYLQKYGCLDMWVLAGSKQKVKVRLIANKLPESKANARRRRAKRDRDKRLNHSKEYYQMLGYHLFITSLDQDSHSNNQIAKIYGLRWRIENIFKCWKSQFHLEKLIPKGCQLNEIRVEAIIFMVLIFIMIFQMRIYHYVLSKANKKQVHLISMTKVCQFIVNNSWFIINNKLEDILPQILYYSNYI